MQWFDSLLSSQEATQMRWTSRTVLWKNVLSWLEATVFDEQRNLDF